MPTATSPPALLSPIQRAARASTAFTRVSEDTGRVKVALGVGYKANAVALELVQVVDRRARALAREAVERPKDEDLELPLVGVLEERLESSAAPGGTRFLISIFLDQLPALVTLDEGAKLPSLILGFLPVGGDSRIRGLRTTSLVPT